MNNLGKAFVLTLGTAGVALTMGGIQADACGLGSTDFKVTASVLNVRTEPNTCTGVVVKKLKAGTVVRPVELSANKAWAKIGERQWVSMSYLQMMDNHTIPNNEADYKAINPTDYIITTSSLNVRKSPSTSSSVIGSVKKDDIVTVTKVHNAWLYVKNVGWIHGNYAKKFIVESNNNVKPQFKETTIAMRELTVTATSLNVRSGPGTNYSVIDTFKKGRTVMTNTQSGNWYKTEFGWLHKDYVTEEMWSLNSNSTWDEILDAPVGDVDPTRTVVVPENGRLNVRYTVALGGSVKDVLPSGTKVTVITNYGTASRIKYINARGVLEFGYVASRYLK